MPSYDINPIPRPSTADAEPYIANLLALSDLALQRHRSIHAEHPKRSTVPYLRSALTCARELAKHTTFHPELRQSALDLTERVIVAATETEATCFAAGGNSAPYIAALIAAEGLRLTLADAPLAQRKRDMGAEFFLHHYRPDYVPPDPLGLNWRIAHPATETQEPSPPAP